MSGDLKELKALFTCIALGFRLKNIAAKRGRRLSQVRLIYCSYVLLPFVLPILTATASLFFEAWDKRTEISTAINVATKKKIPKLVSELKIKLDKLPQVSHTTVIRAKESHLTSKTLKSELHKLANRRFGRAQEVSTERVIAIMSLWAKRELLSVLMNHFFLILS